MMNISERELAVLKMKLGTNFDLDELLNIDIQESSYDECLIEADGEEYFVLTEEEAEQKHLEYIENFIDDVGISGFTGSFQYEIINNYMDNSWFDEAMRESFELYCDDIESEEGYEDEDGNEINRLHSEMIENNCETKEDYIDFLCGQYTDGAEWYKSNFGEKDFNETAKKYCNLDIEVIHEACISYDGIAHSLASYDGNEEVQEVNRTMYYIYRTN